MSDSERIHRGLVLVTRAANSVHRAVQSRLDWDDLYQEGAVALVKAARSFDPRQGVPFDGYAYPRIRGAIIDYIRQELGRCSRERDFNNNLVQMPDGMEIPAADPEMEWGLSAMEAMRYKQELLDQVTEAARGVSGREEMVILHCFMEEESQASAAKIAGVSPTTISNVKASILNRFREAVDIEER